MHIHNDWTRQNWNNYVFFEDSNKNGVYDPPEPFKDVILKHFSLKKDYILSKCKEWVDYSKKYDKEKNNTNYYSKYNSIYEKIVSMYEKWVY